MPAPTGKMKQKNMGPIVIVVMLLFTMLIAFLFLAFFSYAPVLCASCVGIFYVIGLYLSTESNAWHHAQEFENRFWTVMAFLFSTALFYIKDSPFAIGRYSTSLGCILVVAFTLAVQFLDRHIHRVQLAKQGRIIRSPTPTNVNLAQMKTNIISNCLDVIDRIYLPSTINLIINVDQVKEQEQKVLDILVKAEKDELNYILGHIKLALLFYKIKDTNRTLICNLLCETRLMDLTISSRAIVLDALMLMRISAHEKCERWVKHIITRTGGDDLSILKSTTDSKGTFNSMHKLVYHDIRDVSIRNAILNHIKREANIQRAHMQLSTRNIAARRKQQEWRKVLSDVDDTLESSGGVWPAGADKRYPKHCVYPGVLSFYRELDLGAAGPKEWDANRLGNLTFLSARPHVYKDMSEKKSYAKFEKYYQSRGMHTLPSMLAGSVSSGSAFMFKGDLEPMAVKKFENFCEYYSIYPEYKHIFIGDNGQGDVRAAELIMEKYGTSVMEAAYFHVVQPIETTHGYKDRETYRRLNIIFFETYVGAAVQAYRMNQISKYGLQQVTEEAATTFLRMKWASPNLREDARVQLNADIAQANEVLKDKSVPLIGKPQRFDVGTCTETAFGMGLIVAYNSITGIYTVELLEWWSRSTTDVTKIYLPEEGLSTAKRTMNDFSLTKTPTPPSAASPVRTSIVLSMDPVYLAEGILPLRTAVVTPFGQGMVLAYRPQSKSYVVQLHGGRTLAYCQPSSVREFKLTPPPTTPSPSLTGSSSGRSGFVRSSFGYIAKKLKVGFMTPLSPSLDPMATPPPMSIAPPNFPKNTRVQTPFGPARVVAYRSPTYAVQLLDDAMANTQVFVQETSVELASCIDPRKEKPLPPHTLVYTFYGYGRVRSYRVKDSMYEIAFSYGAVGYMHVTSVRESSRNTPSTPRAWKPQTKVRTPFGVGVVVVETNKKGVVGVQLTAPSMQSARVYVQASALVEELEIKSSLSLLSRFRSASVWFEGKEEPPVHPKLGKPVSTLWGPGVLEAIREADQIHVVSFKNGMVAFLDAASVGHVVAATLGDVVQTPYGKGGVVGYRRHTNQFVVQYAYGIGYLQASAIERLSEKVPPSSCAVM
ncbi:Aste57867_19386 [Aphanomyces stellatus]|uniref:Aste57867_19386 protein n=1 Tax=Aphanomyces stellatus TaxID=120398 RepID=A0A485LCN8_9STRA|nr:hypothetical protein As57867_019322 [Aphanomyces stellatus]VFT96100.1 Aste57867_19386 [Aphanomyces stellatus]